MWIFLGGHQIYLINYTSSNILFRCDSISRLEVWEWEGIIKPFSVFNHSKMLSYLLDIWSCLNKPLHSPIHTIMFVDWLILTNYWSDVVLWIWLIDSDKSDLFTCDTCQRWWPIYSDWWFEDAIFMGYSVLKLYKLRTKFKVEFKLNISTMCDIDQAIFTLLRLHN